MAKKKEAKLSVLEESLLRAMQALDNQIGREVNTRTPSEREEHGIKKWEPIDRRVELLTSFILNSVGDQAAGLDSILVLSQAFIKALHLLVSDLGVEGLGDVRASYCATTFERLADEARRGDMILRATVQLN